MSKEKKEKGEIIMNACAIKPKLPFATKDMLARTPASEENRKMTEFINSHNFSFNVDDKTGELKSTVTDKKD